MKIQHRNISVIVLTIASILSVASLQVATFVVSSNDTTAKTLGSGSVQTGTVNSGGTIINHSDAEITGGALDGSGIEE